MDGCETRPSPALAFGLLIAFDRYTYGLREHGDGQPQECPKFGVDAQLHVEGDT